MEEINYNELFGIEEAAGEPAEGENEQEVAAPADEGEKEEEVAAPQSKEENAAYAAARRRAEAESATKIRKAREEAEAYIDSVLREMKLTDPYTGKPITNRQEYEAYRTGYHKDVAENIKAKTGMSDEELNEYIGSIPEVKEAKETAAKLKEERAQEGLQREIDKITKLNPEIKSLEDLAKMEHFDAFYAKVQRGYSFEDAYILVNRDTIINGKAEAARQAAVNAAKSKGHMAPVKSHGGGAVSAPADIREEYRKFMPGLSDAEIDEHYARYRKE